MRGVSLDSRQKSLVLIGVIIASVGFGVHFMVPGIARGGFAVLIDPMETVVEPINLSTGSVEHSFQFDFLGPDHSNLTVYFLDETQFQMYEDGSSPANISEPVTLDVDGRATYTLLVDSKQEFFLVLVSNHTELLTFTYYYSLLPATFFSSVTVGFIGLLLIILSLSWHFSGWKRYFLIGVGTNLVIFLLRIFTLATYSLGLPDIFLDVLQVELYNDYQFFYLSWIPNLWEGAWPYSLDILNYLYPPLWIFTVGILGSTPAWLPGAVIFVFNMLTGILVYKIAHQVSENEKTSIVAMIIYLLNPITVGYGSFAWLNPTPFVFFVMLSFYLAFENKSELSIISLAIATLYKQFAVIFFPIIAVFLIKQISGRKIKTTIMLFLKHTFIYVLVIGIVSLPFLITSPYEYYNQLINSSRGMFERLTYFIPDLWMPVHFGSFFLWISGSSILTDVLAILVYNYVFLSICGFVIYGAFSTIAMPEEITLSDKKQIFSKALLWSLIAVLCLQTFFPRGVYKFYLLILMPFAALLFDYKDLDLEGPDSFTFKKHHLFVPLMTLAIFLCYRFVYLWIIITWAWFYLIRSGELTRIRNGLWMVMKRMSPPPASVSDVIDTWEDIYSE